MTEFLMLEGKAVPIASGAGAPTRPPLPEARRTNSGSFRSPPDYGKAPRNEILKESFTATRGRAMQQFQRDDHIEYEPLVSAFREHLLQ